MGDADPFRELHEAYIWRVNAAVAEGRTDLVRELVDEYDDEALRLMTSTGEPGCGRAECAICAPAPSPPPRRAPTQRRFWRRHRSTGG
jgi:hypothetical protein